MAIERLPRRNLYHQLYRSASACHAASEISAGTPISCWEFEKEMRLQGIVLTTSRPMRFNVVVRDQNGANPFTRKRYLLNASGMLVDYRNWPDSLVKMGANKEICVFMMNAGASGEVFSADLEMLELMG